MSSVTAVRRALDPVVRDALGGARIDGNRLRLGEQLPSEVYAAVKKVLTALGGLWAPAAHATVFPAGSDPAALIAGVLASGVVPLHPRRAEGFVRTPDALADEVCDYPHTDLRWLPAGSAVLEPSAGDGSLVAAVLRTNPDAIVTAVEPNPSRAAVCATLGDTVSVHVGSFEDFAATAIRDRVRFAAVVMNPPYAVPGDPVL